MPARQFENLDEAQGAGDCHHSCIPGEASILGLENARARVRLRAVEQVVQRCGALPCEGEMPPGGGAECPGRRTDREATGVNFRSRRQLPFVDGTALSNEKREA